MEQDETNPVMKSPVMPLSVPPDNVWVRILSYILKGSKNKCLEVIAYKKYQLTKYHDWNTFRNKFT